MKRPGSLRRVVIVAAAALAAAGCGVANIPNPFDRGAAQRQSLRILVDNLNFNDATLHLVTGGSRSRLGVVTGKSTATFSVDWTVPRSVWIDVDLVGEDGFRTNAVDGRPGESLQLLIESDSRRTRLFHGTR